MAIREADHERRERWALLAQGVIEGIVLVVVLVAVCALLVVLAAAMAPSGASLPGVVG
ncbi:MAG: hypothetical protein KGH93_03640 [Patescibacteria group bacterium]|nr:hypothetical protein [Patescibacteria group bacterium]